MNTTINYTAANLVKDLNTGATIYRSEMVGTGKFWNRDAGSYNVKEEILERVELSVSKTPGYPLKAIITKVNCSGVRYNTRMTNTENLPEYAEVIGRLVELNSINIYE